MFTQKLSINVINLINFALAMNLVEEKATSF